jgi:hypothetical protein
MIRLLALACYGPPLLLALLCAGCGPRTAERAGANGEIPVVLDNAADPLVFKDRGTGCEYLAIGMNSAGALTPRLDRNGKQVCK